MPALPTGRWLSHSLRSCSTPGLSVACSSGAVGIGNASFFYPDYQKGTPKVASRMPRVALDCLTFSIQYWPNQKHLEKHARTLFCTRFFILDSHSTCKQKPHRTDKSPILIQSYLIQHLAIVFICRKKQTSKSL
jgi:hypothetical protein